jgi:hypothetical protein
MHGPTPFVLIRRLHFHAVTEPRDAGHRDLGCSENLLAHAYGEG